MIRRSLSVLLLGLVLTLPRPAWCADFSGVWTLDLKASESLDAVLKAQGISWLKRKAAAGLQVTQTIAQTDTQLTVDVTSSMHEKHHVFEVDGKDRVVEGDQGAAVVNHVWEGEVLVTTSVRHDGSSTLVIRRALADDGRTMTLDLSLTAAGAVHTAKRVFRKQ